MILQHLAPGVGAILVLHCLCPDLTGYPTDHGILRVKAIAEEEGEVGRKIINAHSAAEVVLHERKAICECERELGDGVRAGFCDVIPGDGNGIEIPNVEVDEVLLNITHDAEGK